MSERILVSFTSEQRKMLKSLNGIMGNTDAEIVRTIVMSWLSQQDYLRKEDGK